MRVLADPASAHHVQNIAAFASPHVTVAATACILASQAGLPRVLRAAMEARLVVTMIATNISATGHCGAGLVPQRLHGPATAVPVLD